MNPKYRVLQSAIGAVIGFGVTASLEILLVAIISGLFDARITVRGLGWLVLPIAGACFGWKVGRDVGVESLLLALRKALDGLSYHSRIWVSASILWLISSSTFMLLVNPFGRYWNSKDWQTFWLVLILPLAVGALALKLLHWVNKANRNQAMDDK
ncbi:hypothetical protein [Microvirga solisilvae]|uniref:hypothetical protein n=1 Tax=Microvirga solisilvae TaxID=2919498 RepID=UPI001FAF720B|nr:hypothetical protein [Microvirga solisilvae]